MANRRSFLGAVSGAAAASVLLSAPAGADTAPAAPPSPAPSARAAAKLPSATARAQAEAMRRFDAGLSDAEVATIARGIDSSAEAAATLNPHGRLLKNGDEPVTQLHLDLVR